MDALLDQILTIEGMQRRISSDSSKDIKKFIEQEQVLIRIIDDLKGKKWDHEERELKRLNDEIESNEIYVDLLKQENSELLYQVQELRKQHKNCEIKALEAKESYEKELKSIEIMYHENVLKNIERRNYLQKLKIMKSENSRRKPKN